MALICSQSVLTNPILGEQGAFCYPLVNTLFHNFNQFAAHYAITPIDIIQILTGGVHHSRSRYRQSIRPRKREEAYEGVEKKKTGAAGKRKFAWSRCVKFVAIVG